VIGVKGGDYSGKSVSSETPQERSSRGGSRTDRLERKSQSLFNSAIKKKSHPNSINQVGGFDKLSALFQWAF
jgi:hypothetical protein